MIWRRRASGVRRRRGCDAKITEPIVSQALEAGYRHIDTAQAYGTELGVGWFVAGTGRVIPRGRRRPAMLTRR
jgi:diketogulonate reductase-like aldo/keto reductase